MTDYHWIALIASSLYLGIAIFAVTRSPRQGISWVFATFCFSVVWYYTTSLFLLPRPGYAFDHIPLALRLKWAGGIFTAPAYLHLASFFFLPGWRRYLRPILVTAYSLTLLFSLSALLTNWLIAAPLDRGSPDLLIGPVLGPLQLPFLVFFFVQILLATAGVITAYHKTQRNYFRKRFRTFLIPTLLVLCFSLVNWIIVWFKLPGAYLHYLGDGIIILSAFFYLLAVIQYGVIVGHTYALRDFFYGVINITVALTLLVSLMLLDFQLMKDGWLPLPFFSLFAVVAWFSGAPIFRRMILKSLNRIFLRERQQFAEKGSSLPQGWVETASPEDFQMEILRTLCSILDLHGAMIAWMGPVEGGEAGFLSIGMVRGSISLISGQKIALPARLAEGPRIVELDQREAPGWQDIAVYVCLSYQNHQKGILGLGEKRDESPFRHHELALCATLARQIETSMQVGALYDERERLLEDVRIQDESIHRLQSQLEAMPQRNGAYLPTDSIAAIRNRSDAPLQISVLGPLQVVANGQLLPESAWETERARSLFAYLLWKGRDGATRSEISIALWPDQAEEKAAANVFHVTMNRLRTALQPDLERARDSIYIRYEGGKYFFDLDSPHWLDVAVFRSAAESDQTETIRRAADLYRGPYLYGVDWDLPAEVEIERRMLERTYEGVLRRLVERLEGEEAVEYLERLFALNPADENSFRRLQTYYHQRGRQDLANRLEEQRGVQEAA